MESAFISVTTRAAMSVMNVSYETTLSVNWSMGITLIEADRVLGVLYPYSKFLAVAAIDAVVRIWADGAGGAGHNVIVCE